MESFVKDKITFVAGEPSGDFLAGCVLSKLSLDLNNYSMHGIGGPEMMKYGFVSDYSMDKLAVRGLFEVILKFREIKKIRNNLFNELLLKKPKIFIGVDAPDFNLELEFLLKKNGIPTIHMVSPSIWAWRKQRIRKIYESVNHMLVLFPFEKEIYQKAGIPVTYVGHPLASIIPMKSDKNNARKKLNIEKDQKVVAILPGSRFSEIIYNSEVFLKTAIELSKKNHNIIFFVPMVGESHKKMFEKISRKIDLKNISLKILVDNSYDILAASDAVLVASGTATLEVALFKKPMVIAYKMNPASWQILRFMAYQPWFGLPNILSKEFLVPEFFQDKASPKNLSEALLFQLFDEKNKVNLSEKFKKLHLMLSENTAKKSCEVIMKMIS